MNLQKKAPTGREGLGRNIQLNNIKIFTLNHLFINYQGPSNRLPSQKEILDGYYSSMEFFKEREKYHQESASWYFNYLREVEDKANAQVCLAETAYRNYSYYLELICKAYLNGFTYKNLGGADNAT